MGRNSVAGLAVAAVFCAGLAVGGCGGKGPSSIEEAKIAEAQRVIASFQSSFLAAVAETGNPSELSLGDLVFQLPDSEWWTYTVETGGTFTAASKTAIGEVEAGAELISRYNAEADCFYYNIHIGFAKITPHIANNGCRPAASSGGAVAVVAGFFIDPRDEQSYRTVKMDNLTWMAENLNYSTGRDWCYGDKELNCSKYGRLYDWNTAMSVCPDGWRLPTPAEWSELVSFGGNIFEAGIRLKSKTGCESGRHSTDEFGFLALPGGIRYDNGAYYFEGHNGNWWGAADNTGSSAYRRDMGAGSRGVSMYDSEKSNSFSVRCVQMPGGGSGDFTDPRDGRTYRTVEIGNRRWMAENLNYESEEYLGYTTWYYDHDVSNLDKYGRLYNWDGAMAACPPGWHLPANEDWNDLIQAAGGSKVAGGKLKSKTGWDKNGNGTDDFGFSALPGGSHRGTEGVFVSIGEFGRWWSASSGQAYSLELACNRDDAHEGSYAKGAGLSVRCVQ